VVLRDDGHAAGVHRRARDRGGLGRDRAGVRLQATQNRETRALHLKLDELIRVQRRARNFFTDLEHATDEELKALEAEFRRMRSRAEAHDMAKADARRR
jgi:low affinity Fe/Cu permease